LALALLEMHGWGAAYADQVVANAQALGAALEAEGVPCVCVDGRYSQSHTLLACVARFGVASTIAERLEEAGIITTAAHLPEYWGREGIRIGVQEITRLGATEQDMAPLAQWIAQAIRGSRDLSVIAQDTAQFAARLGPVRFTWNS
jgi:glycine hydroxymethyltransferase